uniref:Uncharacterized protein n=1 Tax=Arundo donax TaxID=35708 RepID=A0A0A9FEB4_ARUDO
MANPMTKKATDTGGRVIGQRQQQDGTERER